MSKKKEYICKLVSSNYAETPEAAAQDFMEKLAAKHGKSSLQIEVKRPDGSEERSIIIFFAGA